MKPTLSAGIAVILIGGGILLLRRRLPRLRSRRQQHTAPVVRLTAIDEAPAPPAVDGAVPDPPAAEAPPADGPTAAGGEPADKPAGASLPPEDVKLPPPAVPAPDRHWQAGRSGASIGSEPAPGPGQRRAQLARLQAACRRGGEARLAAMEAALAWGDPLCLPLLRRGLKDADLRVVALAARGLERFRGRRKKPATGQQRSKRPRSRA